MAPSGIDIRLFGRPTVERDRAVVELPTTRSYLLLAYLVLHPGRSARDRVAGTVWGDSPQANARASLRNALSVLRRRLGEDLVESDRGTVGLSARADPWVDTAELRRRCDAYVADPSLEDPGLDGLYRGELLAGIDDDWVVPEREALRALYVRTQLEAAARARARADYSGAVGFAGRALSQDPVNEAAHQHLIFCHAARGQRTAALQAYRDCCHALADLGVEPDAATERLRRWAEGAAPRTRSGPGSVGNVPTPTTSFVGRRADLAAVAQLLDHHRLVTVTGAGGSGKTRLAVELSAGQAERHPDGVWWVPLDAVASGSDVGPAVARTVGAPEVPGQPVGVTVANHLAGTDAVLVLDNCEHVLDSSSELVDLLLRRGPGPRVLATSRERLGVEGERLHHLVGLSQPGPGDADPDAADAVRMLVRRVREVDPHFAMTHEDRAAVAAICRRVEGLPLALELAAPPVARLGAVTVLQRMEHEAGLDWGTRRTGPSRHRDLAAALGWSHDLLDGQERTLFRRLAVFTGGWTLSDAVAVCADDRVGAGRVPALMMSLVDASLVETRTRPGGPRFHLLNPVREYAAGLLADDDAVVRDRHLEHFGAVVDEVGAHLGYFLPDARADAAAARVEEEEGNIRAAVARGLRDVDGAAAETAARMVCRLHWWWFARGRFAEPARWLDALLASVTLGAPTRALAEATAGYLACWQGDFARARPAFERSRELYTRLDDTTGLAFAEHGLGFAALGVGDGAASAAHLGRSAALAAAAGDRWLESFCAHFQAIGAGYAGALDDAAAGFERGDALLEALGGHRQAQAFSAYHRSRIERRRGDRPLARSLLGGALRVFHDCGDLRGVGYGLAGFVVLAAGEDDLRAATLMGAIGTLQEVLGPFLEHPLQVEYDEHARQVCAGLDPGTRDAAESAGRALGVDDAVAFALA